MQYRYTKKVWLLMKGTISLVSWAPSDSGECYPHPCLCPCLCPFPCPEHPCCCRLPIPSSLQFQQLLSYSHGLACWPCWSSCFSSRQLRLRPCVPGGRKEELHVGKQSGGHTHTHGHKKQGYRKLVARLTAHLQVHTFINLDFISCNVFISVVQVDKHLIIAILSMIPNTVPETLRTTEQSKNRGSIARRPHSTSWHCDLAVRPGVGAPVPNRLSRL